MSYEDQLNALKAKVQEAKKEAVPTSPKVSLSKISAETEAGLRKLIEVNQSKSEADITVDGKALNDFITETKQKGASAKRHTIDITTLVTGNWNDR